MISYFILNKSGSIIYQSIDDGKPDGSDIGRIRYLPLLLIKDLIKANLHDHIHHVRSSGKLAAFWERHNLLFIACTKQERVPLAVLHKHLFIIDNYLRFSFGPQWQLRFHNHITTTSHSKRGALYPTITTDHLTTCLAQLPFLGSPSQILRSYHCLCLVEQIDLQEELNLKLSETLRDCCDASFSTAPLSPTPVVTKSATNKLTHFFTSTPRLPSPTTTLSLGYHHQRYQDMNNQHSMEASWISGTWHHAFLFAREKIVIHCSNRNQQHQQSNPHPPITDDLLYYLKMMVADYICENMDYESTEQGSHLKKQDASAPQTIIRTTTTLAGNNNDNVSPSTSSPTLCTSASTNDTPTQRSPSFSYIYDSNSTTPFKIQMKSTITEVSPSTTMIPLVSWSNPPPLIHSHLLSRLPKEPLYSASDGITRITSNTSMRELDDDLLHEMTATMKVTSLTPSLDHYYQQYDNDTPLPPNAKALYQKYHLHEQQRQQQIQQQQQQQILTSSTISPDTSFASILTKGSEHYLSSSVPSSSATIHQNRRRQNSEDDYTSVNHLPILRRHSNNISLSSPLRKTGQRQLPTHDSPPNDTPTSDDSSNHSQQKQKQRQSHHHHGNVKTVRRWLKHGNRIISTRICLTLASDGLVVVLLLPDEVLPIGSPSTSTSRSTTSQQQQQQNHHHHHQQQQQVKQFSMALRTALYDFISFLLTKERAHFTILSFASTYPGLVHFVHIKKGVVFAPRLVDLNDMDKHHEILHEIFEIYAVQPNTTTTSIIGKWRWPTMTRLKKLCTDMLLSTNLLLSTTCSSTPSIRSIQEPTRHRQGFHMMYLSGHHLHKQTQLPPPAYLDPDDELLAIYFSFVPKDRIWAMQHQLISDVSQRHFMK